MFEILNSISVHDLYTKNKEAGNIRKPLIFALFILGILLLTPSAKAETKTFEPIADSFINSEKPTSNFGGQDVLRVTYQNRTYFDDIERRAYLKFNLSEVPSGSTINSAKLRLHTVVVTETTKIGAFYCPDNSWEELEITWENAPDTSGDAVDIVSVADPGEWHEWDVTSIAKKDTTISIVLQIDDSEKSKNPWVSFRTKETNRDPQLVVEYTSDGGGGRCLGTIMIALIPLIATLGWFVKQKRTAKSLF
ncbi:MAG: DNRLRE domain-containing protein [Promethearchaeota archaeon]